MIYLLWIGIGILLGIAYSRFIYHLGYNDGRCDAEYEERCRLRV